MSSSSFPIVSLGFFMYRISRQLLTVTVLLFFNLNSFQIAVARTSKTMLNKSGESGHPYLIPDLSGNAFTTENDVSYWFIIHGPYYVEVVSLYAPFMKRFYHKWVLNFIKGFFCID